MIPTDDLNEARVQKVLGITWQLDKDELQLRFRKNVNDGERLQKENYDPLGWAAPVNLKAKLLVQKLWKKSFTWDEILPEKIQKEWKEIQKLWNEFDLFFVHFHHTFFIE
ncbi:unnamed protein product [Enterobius vermicularis]|uniref:Uncharacterized protein n=1 Tax=Enterobius vermicularis TaxID=51028 RepID=A0A0N4VM51_ENTVE|nr:unnamed protein product [Enterobius vermicularis]